MIRTLIISLFLLSGFSSFSQSTKSVIRLKNGVVIKGEIVEFVQGDYMMMRVMDGQDMRIPVDFVQSFKIKKGKLPSYNLPEQGYFNYTNTGFLFLKANRYEWIEVNMSLHTLNGYRFNSLYSAGLGVGLDRYGTLSSLPVYLSVRRNLFPSRTTPVFSASAGYGSMWESKSYNDWEDFEEVEGGFFWELGAGLRINYDKTALIIRYAYKRQNSKLTMVNNNWWWETEGTIVENHKFRNMALTLGMEF